MSTVVTSPDLVKTLRDVDRRIRILEARKGVVAGDFVTIIDASTASAVSGAVAALPPPLPTGDPSQSGDTTAPNTPSKPTVTGGYPGAILVGWDGLDDQGAAIASDWRQTNVYIYPRANGVGFTPTNANKVGSMSAIPGRFFVQGLVGGSVYYVKITAVDFTGNESGFSVASDPATADSTAYQDVSVGTIRNTDATLFITAASTNPPGPAGPGNLILGGSAITTSDGSAFDQLCVYSNNSNSGSVVATNAGYTKIKPGRYVATFYVRLDSGAGVNATAFSIGVASANGSGVTEDAISNAANYTDVNGTAFTQNGPYFGIPTKLTITAANTPVKVLIKAGSFNFRISHITIDTDSGGIVSGQIRTEFIRDLAIVDAKIDKVRANKIIAGSIFVELGLATNGQIFAGQQYNPNNPNAIINSVYFDSTGIYARSTDTTNNPSGLSFWVRSSDGSAFFGGTLKVGISITSPVITGGVITGSVLRTGFSGTDHITINDGDITGPDGTVYAGQDTIRWLNTSNQVTGEIRGQLTNGFRGVRVNCNTELGNKNSIIYQIGRRSTGTGNVQGGSTLNIITSGGGTSRCTAFVSFPRPFIGAVGDALVPNCVVAMVGNSNLSSGWMASCQVLSITNTGFTVGCVSNTGSNPGAGSRVDINWYAEVFGT